MDLDVKMKAVLLGATFLIVRNCFNIYFHISIYVSASNIFPSRQKVHQPGPHCHAASKNSYEKTELVTWKNKENLPGHTQH